MLAAEYRALQPWNFSADFLSHVAEQLVVLHADGMRWSDWGTRRAIERTLAVLKQPAPWVPSPTGHVAVRGALRAAERRRAPSLKTVASST